MPYRHYKPLKGECHMIMINPLELPTNEMMNGLSNDELITKKKRFNSLVKKMKHDAKRNHCLYCGKEVESFCNSHTVPDFVLRYIATNGTVKTFNSILAIDLHEKEKGIKSAGTFRQICRKCDSEIFRRYEDEAALTGEITDQMMYEIAMKNYLKSIDKRLTEKEMNDQLFKLEPVHDTQIMDLNEYLYAFYEAKKYDHLNKRHKYRIIIDEILPYRTPIAFQGSFALIADLEGNIINDVYCMDEKYRVEELHLCIFPLKVNTRILMFVNRDYTNYKRITRSKMKKLPLSDLLSLVNYMVFLYSEDMYLKGDLSEKILKQLLCVSKVSTPVILGIRGFEEPDIKHKKLKEMYDLINRNTVPNLLSEYYKIT